MTSFGVEWETNILVYLPENRLPSDVKEKLPFYNNDAYKISLTLESWHPEDRKNTKEDCLVNLEAQLGPFNTFADDLFDLVEFKRSCSLFSENWKNMIKNKKVKIKNNLYDILIYSDRGEFSNCPMTKVKSHPKGYGRDIFESSAIGIPQISIGVKLPYIISIFAHFSQLYNDYNDSEVPNLVLNTVYSAYENAVLYADSQNIKDLNIISLFILLSYYVFCNMIYENFKKSYVKSYFLFKIRSNFRVIYDSIGEPESEVKQYFKHLRNNKEVVHIVDTLEKSFFNPIDGYMVDSLKNLEINPLAIVKNDLGGFKKVKTFMVWWNNELPEVQQSSDSISYIRTPRNDFGEWGIGKDNTIYIEFRGLQNVLDMIYKKNVQALTSDQFCETISFVFDNILNPAMKVDPNIAIRDD